MLIRWTNDKDLPAWYALATEVLPIFLHPSDMGTAPDFISNTQSKTSKYEALTAVDFAEPKPDGQSDIAETDIAHPADKVKL